MSAPASDTMAVVPVARLVSGGQRFACVRFACALAAADCVARQDAMTRPHRSNPPHPARPECQGCAQGLAVRARLAAPEAA